MTEPQLSRPLGLRVFNRTGGALRRVGMPLVDLDAAALFDRARRLTGLSDFGDPFFREPLRVLLDSFESEAELTTLGRVIARSDVVRLLQNRLRMADVLDHHPEIAAVRDPRRRSSSSACRAPARRSCTSCSRRIRPTACR